MRRFTLRLPETLFQRLELLAGSEGVSLNQYLVYSLTQNVARAYRPIPVPKEEIAKQHAQFNMLIESLDAASDEEFETILAEGDADNVDTGLDPDLAARVEANIVAARQSKIVTK
ncbi:MAG: toxin-antitoxin system HicB family antitoxin [Chloroflexi bacterium]|nr:toxin-antitoxin system HicB family antitoxin [Chloroflexota bacterium]